MPTPTQIQAALPDVFTQVDLVGYGIRQSGKVREMYQHNGQRLLITTDRISAFDRVLGAIPYKGQVLNRLSAWWFDQMRDLVPTHKIAVPHPNVLIAHDAQPLPVEVIVRGYITGVTSTSLWTLYEQGLRDAYGVTLPDGLKKNNALPYPVITPTTKATDDGHDERLTRDNIITRGLIPILLWERIEATALAIFQRGQALAQQAGLILVDTKYEFGLVEGQLTLIDEVHTPDSSRYWDAHSYADGTLDHYDKEYLRQWYAAQGYRGEGTPPTMPDDLRVEVASRYLHVYERLTGETLSTEAVSSASIQKALDAFLTSR
ncbi:phosphoribosylaminoimidazolesuccinocarboxamide synthase [bacterium]|nr:phosphoribosylaminoimidazolesuccinocarboxamide synthase [bacterium]